MSTAQLLQKANELGINLWIEGERLKYKAPKGVVSGVIKEKLKSHKPEIISLITQRIARANLHGQSLEELKVIAGDDWPECESDPDTLEKFAKSVAIRKLRKQGIKPDSYTQACYCKQCGPVWLWENNWPAEVQACVWCFNRVSGIDIPRPTTYDHAIKMKREVPGSD